MGIFAEGTVDICFDKEGDAKKVHELLTKKIEGEILSVTETGMIEILGEEGKGSYSFYDFDCSKESLSFRLSSGRIQNAEWQIEQVIKLLRKLVQTKEVGRIEDFNSSLMQESDYGSNSLEGDDFEEGGEDE